MAINLRSVDLNLLVIFEALIEERSVARAASRIGLTPSAVSHALRRLRESIGDELLVRHPSGFQPTPQAAKLLATLRPALDQIAAALELPRFFDPSTAHRNFHIGVPDYAGVFLLPRLCAYLDVHAPEVSLSILPLDDRKSADVVAYEGVELRMTIHGEEGITRPVQTERLIEDKFMVLMRREHPLARRQITLEEYLKARHVKVTGLGNAIDNRLAQMGLVRQIMVKIPSWQGLLAIVESTNLVTLIPKHWTHWNEIRNRFAFMPLPLDDFFLTIDALWHPRNEHDLGHRWFRGVIQDIFKSMQTSDQEGGLGPKNVSHSWN